MEGREEGGVIEEIKVSGSEGEERGKKIAGRSGITSMMVTDKMIEILTLLKRKTSAMEKRIEKIEKGINELQRKKKLEEIDKKVIHGSTRDRTFRCTLGRTLLMLGMLGLVASAASSEMGPGSGFENESQRVMRRRNVGQSDDLTSADVGIQALQY
jgi:hypothetical protein